MDSILLAHINRKLEDDYGKMIDGNYPLFRVIWSTNVTEKRYSEFTDFIDDTPIRNVREVREVLKYPFAQDRYILEKITPITNEAKAMGLVDGNYSYEEIYVFQDRLGKFLPLTEEKVSTAMYLYFKFYLEKTHKERTDMRMEMLARRELAIKENLRQKVGERMRSPFYLGVIE
jgi:hypothetical protein